MGLWDGGLWGDGLLGGVLWGVGLGVTSLWGGTGVGGGDGVGLAVDGGSEFVPVFS